MPTACRSRKIVPSPRKTQRDRATAVPDPEPRGYTNGLHFSTVGRSLDGKINGMGRTNGFRAAGAINGGHTNGRTNGRVNGRINGRTNGRTNGRMNGRTNGRTNGRVNGRINGRRDGAVNGLTNGRQSGLVNGRRSNGLTNGLVNGKGAVNGFRLSYQHRKVLFKRHPIRGKLIAVFAIVALIIVIPYVLVFSIPQPTVKIDGHFLDWNRAHFYKDWPDSSDPDIALESYAIKRDSISTYFYIQTRGLILNGADGGADGFYIFIDVDDDPNTGYSTRGIGAEAVVRVVGWNGTVKDAGTYSFLGTRNNTDYEGFELRSGPAIAFTDDKMELSCDVGLRAESRVAIVARHTGIENDWSDVNFRMSGAALSIDQVFDADEVVQSGVEEQFLTVQITDKGEPATVTGLNLSVLGNATPVQITAHYGLRVIASSSGPDLAFSEPIRIGDRSTVEIRIHAVLAPGQEGSTFGLALDETKPVSASGQVTWRISTSQEGARIAYVDNPPSRISVDGAFGDWAPRVPFLDPLGDVFSSKPLSHGSEDIDISGVKVSSAPDTAYFYVAVNGTMLGGSSVPTDLVRFVRPTGPAQNVTNVSEPIYGADFAMVFVDSDLNQSTGYEVGGSEAAVVVVGKDNWILSSYACSYSGGQWTMLGPIEAALDHYQLEIGAAYSLLGLTSDTTYPMTFVTEDWRSSQDDISVAFTARISAGTRAFGGIILNEINGIKGTGDWVELYNSGPVPISIAGYRLYADGRLVFTFPSITLNPGQFYVTPSLEFGKATNYQLFDSANVQVDQTTTPSWQEKTWGRTGLPPYSQWTKMKPSPGAANAGQVIPEFSDALAAAAIVPIMLIAIRRISSRRNPPVGEHQNGR